MIKWIRTSWLSKKNSIIYVALSWPAVGRDVARRRGRSFPCPTISGEANGGWLSWGEVCADGYMEKRIQNSHRSRPVNQDI